MNMYELCDPRAPNIPRFIYYGRLSLDELWEAYKEGRVRNEFFEELDSAGLKPALGIMKLRGVGIKASRIIRDCYTDTASRGIFKLKEDLRGRPMKDGRRAVIATDEAGNETYYESIQATARDGHHPRLVHYCLAGTQKKHHKLKWRYAGEERQERPVERIGSAHYPSLGEASRRTGFPRNEIRHYLDTTESDRDGYHWRWLH
jgi:hypothetical protein